MFNWMLAGYLRNYQFLSDAVAEVTREQWEVVEAQSRFGLALWDALLRGYQPVASSQEPPGKVAEPAQASFPNTLQQETAKRLKEGLAPPREIYDVQNRGRIDWASVPDWAKPVDPEVFEGAHEG
jgi:hypothetical protein